jgi:hypothetical protein
LAAFAALAAGAVVASLAYPRRVTEGPYRQELDAALARARALEDELATAHERIAELEGKATNARKRAESVPHEPQVANGPALSRWQSIRRASWWKLFGVALLFVFGLAPACYAIVRIPWGLYERHRLPLRAPATETPEMALYTNGGRGALIVHVEAETEDPAGCQSEDESGPPEIWFYRLESFDLTSGVSLGRRQLTASSSNGGTILGPSPRWVWAQVGDQFEGWDPFTTQVVATQGWFAGGAPALAQPIHQATVDLNGDLEVVTDPGDQLLIDGRTLAVSPIAEVGEDEERRTWQETLSASEVALGGLTYTLTGSPKARLTPEEPDNAAPLGSASFLNGTFLVDSTTGNPITLADPASLVIVQQASLASDGALEISRVGVDGTVLWTTPLTPRLTNRLRTACLLNDTLVAAGDQGATALDDASGATRWSIDGF